MYNTFPVSAYIILAAPDQGYQPTCRQCCASRWKGSRHSSRHSKYSITTVYACTGSTSCVACIQHNACMACTVSMCEMLIATAPVCPCPT